MSGRSRLLMALVVAWGSAAWAAGPTTAPATRPAAKSNKPNAVPVVLVEAADQLVKEFQAYATGDGTTLRSRSEFFKGNLPAGVTTDQVIQGIAKPVSKDVRADAYARWQMLSGVQEQLTPQQGQRLLAIYRSSAAPDPRPGSSAKERQRLDQLVQRPGLVEATVNRDWKAELDRQKDLQQPMIAFRNDLFGRIPMSADLVLAGLEDAYQRMPAGVWDWDGSIVDRIYERTLAWAITQTDARVLRTLAQRVQAARTVPRVSYYDGVESRSGSLVWKQSGNDLNREKLVKLEADLLDIAAKAGRK